MSQPVYVFQGARNQTHRDVLKTLVRTGDSEILYDVPVPRKGNLKGRAWVPDEGGWVSLEVSPQPWGLEWAYGFTFGGV